MNVALHAFPDEAVQAQRLADAMRLQLALVRTHVFPDGEILPRVPRPASTTIVYRSLDHPNNKLVELLLAADGWRRSGAKRLVLVAPYLPYMRQDAAFAPDEPLSQRVIAGLLDDAFDRIVTVDPHIHRINALSDVFPTAECTLLHGGDALVAYLRALADAPNWLVVGPDSESAPWVQRIADPLGLDHAVMDKRRRGDLSVDIALPEGLSPSGRPVLLVDDICSSGTTLRESVLKLKSAGAGAVAIFVTHALGGDAVIDSLLSAGAERVISSDSCSHSTNHVHLADLLASALKSEAGGHFNDRAG